MGPDLVFRVAISSPKVYDVAGQRVLNSSIPSAPTGRIFKVRGKVIMLMTDVPGRPVVILKADPVDAHTYGTDTRAAR